MSPSNPLRALRGRSAAAGPDGTARGATPAGVAFRLATLLAAYVAVDRAILRIARVPESAYFEPILSVEILRSTGWPLAALAVLAVATLARFGALAASWRAGDDGEAVRRFIVFLACILAWPVLTQPHDLYFDQGHVADKALLVATLVGLAWRPAFVLPAVVLLAAMLRQPAAPGLGGSILAHKFQLLHVLNLFAAAFLVQSVSRRRWTTEMLFLCGCLIAGAYFTAALAKIEIDWLAVDDLHLMPVSAHAHGWLDGLGAERIAGFAETLRPFGPAMQWAVLAVEGGALAFFVHRRVSWALLGAFIGFHLGVLALYGFFFWTWILLDAAFLAVLVARADLTAVIGARRTALALSVLLVGSSAYWANPPRLGWFDTGLTYAYRVEAIDESGRAHPLHPAFFGPYRDVFTMVSFPYLARDHRVLTATYGVTKEAAIARAIAAAQSPEALLDLEARAGHDSHRPAKVERLTRFLARYAANHNAREGPRAWLAALAPPPQFISHRAGAVDLAPDRIRALVVYERTTWFDGTRPRIVRDVEVLRVAPDAGRNGRHGTRPTR